MPALFAYLIAVGLLLGGGYGALNWLAAPEPVKVAKRTKPPPHQEPKREAVSEISSREASSGGDSKNLRQSEQAMVRPNDETPSTPSPSEENAVARVQGTAQATGVSNSTQERAPTANVEIRSAQSVQQQAEQQVMQPAPAAPAVSTGTKRATAPSDQAAAAAKTVKRGRQRQASNRAEKSGLALMTLRTIQFADGRRVTQLVPYRPSERTPAFEPDD
jgi:hypothetical protein